jgi:hypothetical protein
MHNNTNKGMFHKIGLSFGQAGGIAKVITVVNPETGATESQIVAIVAAWVRLRKGPTDKVFYTTPQSLTESPQDLVRCEVLEGELARKRYDMDIYPNPTFAGMLESSYPGGCYASILMNRVGQYADFATTMYKLNPTTWQHEPETVLCVPRLADWLHEDFLAHARDVGTAWPILYSAAALFGGQDPADMPAAPAGLPQDLSEACAAEERFRASRRRARALTHDQIESFRQKLAGTTHLGEFEALLRGERSHV